jgi:hypothetical protein
LITFHNIRATFRVLGREVKRRCCRSLARWRFRSYLSS